MNFIDVTTADHVSAQGPQTAWARFARSLGRIRYQLIGALFFSVVLPSILRKGLERFPDEVAHYDNTLLGTLAALLLGFLFFRKVTALPGSSAMANIFPAFLSSFLVIAAVFFAFRLQYSRAQFLMSFVFMLGWFYTVMISVARARTAEFGLVGAVNLQSLKRIKNISWRRFDSPKDASHFKSMPLVVDFHANNLDEEWERYIAEEAIKGRRILGSKQLMESLQGRVRIDHLSENAFGHLAPDSIYAPAKRYVDGIVACLALIFFAPIMLIVAIVIRLDSKGPAIFRQQRMGYRGVPFTVLKFRSMRVADDSNPDSTADMTKADDDRITRVGRFIRKSRLDELPQIINILLGQMSWIGPRPETVNLSAMYEKEIPFYRYRHIVRPGISGWAQVKQGHVTSVDDVRLKLEYDFYYVRHFSLWTDILIAIKTIQVMFTGSGAK